MKSPFRLRPSAAAIWVICHAHVQMSERYPETEDGVEAREGTAAHEVWSAQLSTGVRPAVGATASNGVTITQAMHDGADMVLGVIKAWGYLPLHVEQQMAIPLVHVANGGTPDFWAYDEKTNTLYLGDYKYGHAFVDVYLNWQLLNYLAGIEYARPGCKVVFTIVQPRYYHGEGQVRTWRTTVDAISNKFSMLRFAADKALGSDPGAFPGGHCEFCSGRHACATLQQAGARVTAVSGQMTPFDLPPIAVGHELTRLKLAEKILNARITGLEQQAISMIRSGKRVVNWTVSQKPGRPVWLDGKESEVIGLGLALGTDLQKKPEPITPTQAIAAGVAKEVIEIYAHRPMGELKLTPFDASDTSKIFGE